MTKTLLIYPVCKPDRGELRPAINTNGPTPLREMRGRVCHGLAVQRQEELRRLSRRKAPFTLVVLLRGIAKGEPTQRLARELIYRGRQ